MTLEEINDKFCVEVLLDVDAEPGERAVRYYPDGSGYPGSPPTAEFEVHCLAFWNESIEVHRDAINEGWFLDLDRIIDSRLHDDLEQTERGLLDAIADRFEPCL